MIFRSVKSIRKCLPAKNTFKYYSTSSTNPITNSNTTPNPTPNSTISTNTDTIKPIFDKPTSTPPQPSLSSTTATTTNVKEKKLPNIQPPKLPSNPIKLDGKVLAAHIKKSIKTDTEDFIKNSGIVPHLVVVYVGDNKQIESYIKAKKTGCEEVGFRFTLDRFSTDITEDQLIKKIKYHSEDPSVHGIIVQLPLPEKMNRDNIIQAIDPKKDVDGLTSLNMGQIMVSKKPLFIPCTPLGILEIFKAYNIKLEGKNVSVLGRSNLVGRTIATLLSTKDMSNPSIMGGANVTTYHKYSKNYYHLLKNADVIISATGVPGLVKKEYLKPGVILIDVGINYKEDSNKKSGYRMVGDVDPDSYEKALAYTPVPGGVGPLTVACLLRNVLKSSILHYRIQCSRLKAGVEKNIIKKSINNDDDDNNNNNNNNDNNNHSSNNNINRNSNNNINNNNNNTNNKKNNNINKKKNKK